MEKSWRIELTHGAEASIRALERSERLVVVSRIDGLENDGLRSGLRHEVAGAETQYEGREAWNRSDPSGMHAVPLPYDNEPIAWSAAQSLCTGSTRFVPAGAVYLGFRGMGREFCRGDSNGLASGNCLEEAILQALLELIERDAVALWWYNRVQRPGVDLTSARDPWVEQVRTYHRSLNRSLSVLDVTTDIGVPCFAAVSTCESETRRDVIFGLGAHLDAGIALSRAISEMNQLLPTVLQPPEERRRRLLPEFALAVDWWETAWLDDHPYLVPDAHHALRRLSAYPTEHGTDLRDVVLDCVSRVAAVGCDVLVHDLTRPDVDLAVARVIAPGLRHFWRRLAPGRLYDTPVRMGWIGVARSEHDMNPVSLFV